MSFFVHRPILFFAVAAIFAALYVAGRSDALGWARRSRAAMFAAVAWIVGGVWELLVMSRSPEANIRVDLLLILPALGLLSLWALVRVFLQPR